MTQALWTDETWAVFFDLLDRSWPGELDPAEAPVYRLHFDGTDPETVVGAVRRLLHRGQRFRPAPGEILSEIRADPSRPTFAEAFMLIFGPRGVLRARPPIGQRRYADAAHRRRAEHQAMVDRAGEMHEIVGGFIASQGLDRLRELQLDDPDYGQLRRKELEADWNAYVERTDDRQVAAAALPAAQRRGELVRLNPLTVLETQRPVPALPAGGDAA